MKAYLVHLGGWDGIVLTDRPSRAKAAMTRSARAAGYGYAYTSARVTRAPGFDHLADPLTCSRRCEPNRPYTLEYASAPCRCTKCEAARERKEQT